MGHLLPVAATVQPPALNLRSPPSGWREGRAVSPGPGPGTDRPSDRPLGEAGRAQGGWQRLHVHEPLPHLRELRPPSTGQRPGARSGLHLRVRHQRLVPALDALNRPRRSCADPHGTPPRGSVPLSVRNIAASMSGTGALRDDERADPTIDSL
ncbi:hypothetical protein SCOCK_490021 [Actinacidiphila cocklensis]|uniref:Uncharacterized protein n=1 Tax=Actinacidiphila cocklensis TaxID=887465 RepID=A0A9W4GU34_9ACTN|nr:hypothetical protein SCOCK_490021 [Actinacidiphila cocklensis]